jgi:CTP:phosphocholine cytidylyltransferase-like protein
MGRKTKGAKRETVQMRLILKGLLMERFLYLKEKYGAKTNKALVELLITEKYTELKRE